LRNKYGGVTSKKGLVHEYLGIEWDFSTPGQVSLSMEGYINDIFAKHKVEKVQLRAYVDASYAVYQDAKSVYGIVLMLGDAVIHVKSSKRKIVTRSSTESELVAISDSRWPKRPAWPKRLEKENGWKS
jgi:hypothetical protein